jgi:hypothetical protein
MPFMLGVANKPFMLTVVMLNVVILNVVMLNVVMLNGVMLNVVAPVRYSFTESVRKIVVKHLGNSLPGA